TWKEYYVPIVPELEPWLRLLKVRAMSLQFSPDEQIFNVNRFSSRCKRRQMNTDQVENGFYLMSSRLGFPITPHRFRHTIATDMMQMSESNLHLVKQLLGHSDIRTTLEYVYVDLRELRQGMERREVERKRPERYY